jgi:hypothetical protein
VAAVQYTFTHKQYTEYSITHTLTHKQYTEYSSTHTLTHKQYTEYSSTHTLTHKQYTEHTKRNIHNNKKKNIGKCGPCPVFASYTLAFALQQSKKHAKTSVVVVEKCPDIPVAAVQYTFTHKQYTFTHKQHTEHRERNIYNNKKNGKCGPCHVVTSYTVVICFKTEEKSRKNLSYGSGNVPRYPSACSKVHIYTQTVHRPTQ